MRKQSVKHVRQMENGKIESPSYKLFLDYHFLYLNKEIYLHYFKTLLFSQVDILQNKPSELFWRHCRELFILSLHFNNMFLKRKTRETRDTFLWRSLMMISFSSRSKAKENRDFKSTFPILLECTAPLMPSSSCSVQIIICTREVCMM